MLPNVSQFLEDRITPENVQKFAVLDAEAINFFLCQNHILGYEEIISMFKNKDHTLAWSKWVEKYIHLLKKSDSQALKVFG